MSALRWLQFHLWDPIGTINSLVEKWKPGRCPSEKDYERSLAAYLDDRLPGVKFVSQYGFERARVDIVVGSFNRVAIELKKDLNTTAKMQRLIGQLHLYAKKFSYVVLVICGENHKDLVQEIRDYCVRLEPQFAVIEKPLD